MAVAHSGQYVMVHCGTFWSVCYGTLWYILSNVETSLDSLRAFQSGITATKD